MPNYASLVGQEVPERILRRAVRRGQLAHALIFQGEEGLGMEAAAWALARTLLCQKGGEEPCEACPGCTKSRLLDHPDLEVILPLPSLGTGSSEDENPAIQFNRQVLDAFKVWIEQPLLPLRPQFDRDKETESVRHRQIQVAQARHLKKWANLRPFESRYRVAILVEVERMGVQAQNALLKLLEEPPEQLILLLCTQQPETLLPTILSRCQSLTLRPAPLELLTAWLEERGVATAAGLTSRDLAQLAGGNPGRALRLAGERTEGGDETWEPVDFLRDVLAAQSDGLYQRINAMDTARDRERLRRFLGELQSWLLDAELVRRLGAEARQRVLHADQYDDLERFATRVRLERPDVVLEQLSEARRLCERNVHTFTLLLTLAHMLRRECAALGRKRTA